MSYQNYGLGFVDPITATAAAKGIIGTVSSLYSSLFGNPKDQERKATSERLFEEAYGGNLKSRAQLRCLAGVGTQADEDYGWPGCVGGGWATKNAQDYAKALVNKLPPVTTGQQVMHAAKSPLAIVALGVVAFFVLPKVIPMLKTRRA